MTELFRNKYRIPSARLKSWDYENEGMYFVTICTAGRECYFGNIVDGKMNLSEIGQVAHSEWFKTPELRPDMDINLGGFVVMPNHIHGIIIIGKNHGRAAMHGASEKNDGPDDSYEDAMHGVSTANDKNRFGPQRKNVSSILRGYKSAVTTYARKNHIFFDWQTRFHDHIIRSHEDFDRISQYIAENPLKWDQDQFFQIDSQTGQDSPRDAMRRVSEKNDETDNPERDAMHSVSTGDFQISRFIKSWNSGQQFFTLQTSGSTGKPKQIRVSRQSMVRSAELTGQALNLKKGDSALLCMPVEFVAGKMMLVRTLVLDLKLMAVKPASNPLKQLDKKIQIDFAAMTPMQVMESLKDKESSAILRNIKKLIIGGAPVSLQLERELQQLPFEFYETYGMTETLTHIALRRLNGKNRSEFFQALPGIEIRTDKLGCLVIHAPHLDQPEVITNDLVEIVNENQFRWLGRADNVINSGGIKIFPELVEKKLESIIRQRFVITSLPDEKLGQKVVLVIESSTPTGFETPLGLINEKLDHYERPREIFSLQSFPETASGKIIRSEVQKLLDKIGSE